MKTRNPPRWYVEYENDTRCYAVKKDGFRDSIHRTKIGALERIIVLEDAEKLTE